MKKKLQCWLIFECKEKKCPVYKQNEPRCWLIQGTRSREEIQGKFLEKMEMCLKCEIFHANIDIDSMEETLNIVNEQYSQFRKIVDKQNTEIKDTNIELALGLSEVFKALEKVSSGDLLVRIPEVSKIELIAKLKHMVNLTAENLKQIVDLSHEFAIGLAEHFEVLNKVSMGDLDARISAGSPIDLLESLGKVTNQMIQSVSAEITERKQAVEEMRRSEEKYRLLIKALPSVVYKGYKDWSVEFIDRKIELLTGYDIDDFNSRKMKWSDVIVKENIKDVKKNFLRALKTDKSYVREYPIRSKAGDIIWIQDRGQIVCNNRGEIEHISGVFFDITAHKQAEAESEKLYEQLKTLNLELEDKIKERTRELREALKATEQANQTKSDFLASMSHELRTPLNAIIGFSEIIADKTFGPLNEKQERYVANILSSGRHLLQLINDILDLSKVEAGKMELEPARIKLKGFLENSLIMIEEKALKQGIGLNLEVAAEMEDLKITADERKLKQIIFNLLSNAVKFTPRGGSITLAAKRVADSEHSISEGEKSMPDTRYPIPDTQKDFIEISVSDTGIGIQPEDQERIFDEFEQIDSSYQRKQGGTGLGLALTRKLVELHEGRIWVESKGHGKGSRFSFVLPVKAKHLQKDEIEASHKILLNHLNRAISLSVRHARTFTLCRFHADGDKLEFDEIILRDLHEIQKRSHDFLGISKNKALYLILPETDRQSAQVVCDRFAGELESVLEGCPVSFSLATFPQDGESPDELLAWTSR